MPHASTVIRFITLESRDEMSQWQCFRRSRWRWDVSDFDGRIGAKKVYSELKAHSMICNHREKNASVNSSLLRRAYLSNKVCKSL
jgi:hypothetical protein